MKLFYISDVPPEDGDIVTDILSELSNHNERLESHVFDVSYVNEAFLAVLNVCNRTI